MAYNQAMTERVSKLLAPLANVEMKRMFRGIAFMVNGKMCISAGDDELMFRIDPINFESLLKLDGCRPMLKNGKVTRGYIYIKEASLEEDAQLQKWIDRAISFNNKIAFSARPE